MDLSLLMGAVSLGLLCLDPQPSKALCKDLSISCDPLFGPVEFTFSDILS